MKILQYTLIFSLPIIASSIILYVYFNKEETVPTLQDTWWGPGVETVDDISIKNFTIHIPERTLDKLRHRLHNVEFTPPLQGVQQQYGINTLFLKQFVDYWKNKYTWRLQEESLNALPQYVTQIQGLNIHFVHIKPPRLGSPKPVPLLMLHGWGGSFREFYKIVPYLTSSRGSRQFTFELIIPSLPGFAFSDATSKTGLGPPQMAVILKNLMLRLKIEQFYVHGGDWGGIIATYMATLFPEHVLGLHSNLCLVNTPTSSLKMLLASALPSIRTDADYTESVSTYHRDLQFELRSSYLHIQATKPDTLGVAFKDSPIGWAAYLLEKYSLWTNPNYRIREDAGLTLKYTHEDLLDTIMIYWLTDSITTSMRLFAEAINPINRLIKLDRFQVYVPTACTKFEHEIYQVSDSILEDKFVNLIHTSRYPIGGHFPALELPHVLANDIFTAIQIMENTTRIKYLRHV